MCVDFIQNFINQGEIIDHASCSWGMLLERFVLNLGPLRLLLWPKKACSCVMLFHVEVYLVFKSREGKLKLGIPPPSSHCMKLCIV